MSGPFVVAHVQQNTINKPHNQCMYNAYNDHIESKCIDYESNSLLIQKQLLVIINTMHQLGQSTCTVI